ncbi:MAG: hypothetical protein DMG77_09235, partial [Acidobacteria bacterium]
NVPLECGCPPPPSNLLKTEAPSTTPLPDSQLPAKANLGSGATAPDAVAAGGGQNSQQTLSLSSGPETAALPPSKANEVHVQVDAPFVFSAKDRPSVPPAPVQAASELPVADSPERQVHLDAIVEAPPAPPAKVQPHGFFRRVKGFFSAMFR